MRRLSRWWPELCAAALLLVAFREALLWVPRAGAMPQVVGWFFQSSASSPQLVYGVAGLLLIARRRALRAAAAASRPAPLAAVALLLPGVSLFVWGRHVGAVQPEALALPFVLAGLCMARFGPGVTRAAALPLLLLLFAIPLPPPLSHAIVHPLQLATGATTGWLLRLGGITAVREGDVLYLADGTFDVWETCSGLRSMETLTQLAIVYVAFFRTRPLHGLLLIASAPVIGFAINALRVLFIVLEPSARTDADHVLQGVVMFVAGAAALRGVDALLLRVWPLPERDTGAPAGTDPADSDRPRRLALAVAAGLALASIAVPRLSPPERGEPPTLTLPLEVDGWVGSPADWDPFHLGSVRYTRASTYRYRRDRQEAEVFLGSDDRLRRAESFLSPKNRLPGRGWEVLEERSVVLEPGAQPMTATLARSGAQELLSYSGYRGVEGLTVETLRSLLAIDRSPYGRRPPGRVVRLATRFPQGEAGRDAAARALRDLYAALSPHLWSRDSEGSP